MLKFKITLDQVDYETLLDIVAKAYEQGKLQWSLTDSIIKNSRVIYEPKNEGA